MPAQMISTVAIIVKLFILSSFARIILLFLLEIFEIFLLKRIFKYILIIYLKNEKNKQKVFGEMLKKSGKKCVGGKTCGERCGKMRGKFCHSELGSESDFKKREYCKIFKI